jgi:protease-4
MAEETKKRRGCGLGCLVALLVGVTCLFLMVAAGLFVAASAGGKAALFARLAHRGSAAHGEDEMPRMREIWSSGRGDTKAVRIRLDGVIMLGEGHFGGEGEGSAATALRAIKRATIDEDVEAILIEIDSPGGGITASDVVYHALREFRASREGRVVVALLDDTAASGGYYVALAADRIVAHPTTLTGSIGVLMKSLNLRELAGKIGVRDVTIKSGDNKDLLNPLTEISPDQLAMLQRVVDALHGRFVRLVAENRKLPEEEVRALADGRVFLAEEARAAGLIDEIGYAADADAALAEILETDELRFVRYEEEPSFLELFRAPRLFGGAELKQLLRQGETRLLYQRVD